MRLFRKQRTKLWAVLIVGLAACLAGIAYAVLWGVAADGGRGGAIAVALAFAALFTSTPSVAELIEAPDEQGEPAFDERPASQQILRLRSAIATMLDAQRVENTFLVITSVAGTLTWAFGDVVAVWLGALQ